MDKTLEKKLVFLKIYTLIITLAVLVLFYLFIKQDTQAVIKEITVERINIVERNGDLKLVISNSERQHPGIIDGVELPGRERPAGLIFFNSMGDECGGLVYEGNEEKAGMVLSYDQFRDDQIMQLQYIENTKSKQRIYGLKLWEYPKENAFKERVERFNELMELEDERKRQIGIEKMREDSLLMVERLFVGKDFSNNVGIFIYDDTGNHRIKLYIDENNYPQLKFFDNEGNIISRQ